MSRLRRVGYLVSLVTLVALVGCPKELPRDLPADEFWRMGRAAYERGDYSRAIEALQRMLFQDPSHPKADSAAYMVGDSYFHEEQYLTAASEFLRLAQNRPAGPLADDSRYRACLSYFQLSPRAELDQKYTRDAIDQCRSVILLYPNSPYASQAQARIEELRDKLAEKYYLNAMHYFRRRAYDSAIIYLEYLVEHYRGTAVEPEALLKLYESYVKVGYLEESQQIRERLLSDFPNSPEAQELQGKTANGPSRGPRDRSR